MVHMIHQNIKTHKSQWLTSLLALPRRLLPPDPPTPPAVTILPPPDPPVLPAVPAPAPVAPMPEVNGHRQGRAGYL